MTAFIGPSGCGKSTLLRTFNRIYELYPGQRATGHIGWATRTCSRARDDVNKVRAKIGMVFQKPTPFPMSVHDNISFGVRLYERLSRADMDERVEWSLRKAALWDEVKDKLRQDGTALSGGQQQRLCIARAVAVKPEVLLARRAGVRAGPDLDAEDRAAASASCKSEYTIAVVTHNMQQAARVSDYTAFMYLGRLVEFGDTKTLFTHPTRTADGGVHHGEVRMSTTGLREHTSQDFEAELNAVRLKLMEMGRQVDAVVEASGRALVTRDVALANQIILGDDETDDMELEIDHLCLEILARRQPVAGDLRLLTSALKLVVDLERIGDLGVSIATRVVELDGTPPPLSGRRDPADADHGARDGVGVAGGAGHRGRRPRDARVIDKDEIVDSNYAQMFIKSSRACATTPSTSPTRRAFRRSPSTSNGSATTPSTSPSA